MKLWWLADTQRLALEKAAVDALACDTDWFSLERWRFLNGRLCAEGVIRVADIEYPVRLVYPDQFPQVPAWAEPQDMEARWSDHQFGAGGPLCLELRPDTWSEVATGADVLQSAHHLLVLEHPNGRDGERTHAPSAPAVGAIQSYDWFMNPFFMSAGCIERLQAGTAADVRATFSSYLDNTVPVFVHDAVDRERVSRPPDAGGVFGSLPVFIAAAPPDDDPKTRAELVAAAAFSAETADQFANATCPLVLFANAVRVSCYQALGDGSSFRRHFAIIPDDFGERSARGATASEKRVAIIGAGSVGSKLAESLLRSGVHRLTLIDGDVMLPANLERHALDWRDVGFRKVRAVKRRLHQIVPGAQIEDIPNNLNWQCSSRTHAGQVAALADCDVIVDATGDVPTSLFLGAVAAGNNRAFVSVEVFEGGIGALVASCLPGRDPPYASCRAAFMAWCDEKGEAAPRSRGRRYESFTEDGTPVVADDAAVTTTVGHAARVILDILDGRPAPRDSAWLLIGFRKAWVFEGHGHTIRMSVGAADGQPSPPPADRDAVAFVAALLQEAVGEPVPPE